MAECSCTVKNRLVRGWAETTVLYPYYARSVTPTSSEVITATAILNGSMMCDSRLYFMFGLGDVKYLKLTNVPPIVKVVKGREEVWFYEYWYKRRK